MDSIQNPFRCSKRFCQQIDSGFFGTTKFDHTGHRPRFGGEYRNSVKLIVCVVSCEKRSLTDRITCLTLDSKILKLLPDGGKYRHGDKPSESFAMRPFGLRVIVDLRTLIRNEIKYFLPVYSHSNVAF